MWRKKAKLEIDETEYEKGRKGRKKATLKGLIKKLEDYRNWLLELTICDPACGSGAFLNQALEFLISEHRYIDELNAKLLGEAMVLSEVENSILENNLFGVDINEESVEIAKLSLWLRTAQKGRKLTSLNNNIKCGNSLISNKEIAKDKTFDWQQEFSTVFEKGGFDVVIGNPPYLGGRDWKEEDGRAYDYLSSAFEVAEYQFDMYVLFWEKGIRILKSDGKLGFITPITWLNNQKTNKLRSFILNQTTINRIVDLSDIDVFKDAVVLTMIGILTKKNAIKNDVDIIRMKSSSFKIIHSVHQSIWIDGGLNIINVNLSNEDFKILEKVASIPSLEELGKVKRGVMLYEVGKGTPKQTKEFSKNKIYESEEKIDDTYRLYLQGKDINTYLIDYKGRWVKYGENLAAPRTSDLFENPRILVRRIVGDKLICAYTDEDYVTSQLMHIVILKNPVKTKYVLGLLNSTLLAYIFRKKFNRLDKTFPEIRIYELLSLPIKFIESKNTEEEVEKLVNLNIELNIEFNKNQSRFIRRLKDNFEIEKTTKKLHLFYKYDFKLFLTELKKKKIILSMIQQDDWEEYFLKYKGKLELIQDQILDSNKKIDQLVYQIYGLTEAEVNLVEKSTP